MAHPHDPYAIAQQYGDLYRDEDVDMPCVPPIAPAQMDPHSQRLGHVSDLDSSPISAQ